MNLLSLDLATQTGWACHANGITTSGSECFRPKKGEVTGTRFLKFRSWLRDQIVECSPDCITYEEVMRWSSGAAAKCYCGLLAILQTECASKGIPCKGIHVGTIKKHATGKGNASKDEMLSAARKKGFDPVDDNEADALHLLSHTRDDSSVL